MKRDAFLPFLGWLILSGLMLFGGFLLWHYGLWLKLTEQDQTYLSSIIMVIFAVTTLYLGRSAWRMSRETKNTEMLSRALRSGSLDQVPRKWLETDADQPIGWAHNHLSLLAHQQQFNPTHPQTDTLQARLIEQVHGGHQTGWFLSDLLLRLGLVGTVIGFVLMLGAVYELQEEGIQALKQLLTSMGGGMQVALYTTLTGLGTATLISIQCHWLDRCADRLVSRIIEMGVTDQPTFTSQTSGNH